MALYLKDIVVFWASLKRRSSSKPIKRLSQGDAVRQPPKKAPSYLERLNRVKAQREKNAPQAFAGINGQILSVIIFGEIWS